jgi:hypothetical protein
MPIGVPKSRRLLFLALSIVSLYVVLTAARIYDRKYYVFLPDYIRWAMTPADVPAAPTHVFFLFIDHFEPSWSVQRTQEWAARYRVLAARHRDSTGRPTQHTWTYPGEQIEPQILGILHDMMTEGLGEVELHYHHDWDDAHTLANGLGYAIGEFQKYGFLKTVTGQTAFAFVHGNSGLDNADGENCGVDDEIKVLRAFGCFADFTYPALYHIAQPPMVNTIYAARDDDQPKSYQTPFPLLDLTTGKADLMIFQGPLVIAPSWNPRRLFLDVEDGNIHPAMPANATRVHRWVNARVHIPERPDWVFIKTWGHSASTRGDMEEFLGPDFDSALTELERNFNDGKRYVLHYVTAREAFNLARAAADGKQGDPRQYYDYVIPPYMANVGR